MARFAKMMTHIFAIIILFSLCLHSTAQQSSSTTTASPGALDGDCLPNTQECTDNADHVCDTNLQPPKCKIRNGATCTAAGQVNCVDGATCTGNPLKCSCDTDRAPASTTEPICLSHLPPGHTCGQHQPTCVAGANCNAVGLCQCDSSHFETEGTCQPRRNIGDPCLLNITTQNMCLEGASCDKDSLLCKCLPSHYQKQDNCVNRITPGNDCDGNVREECIEHAVCLNRTANRKTCQCKNDFYNNGGTCERRKSPGMQCLSSEECVAHAECSTANHCTCIHDTHYVLNNTCHQRQHIDGACDETIPDMCLVNGVCIGHKCVCNNSTYRVNAFQTSVSDTCASTKRVNETCSLANHDMKQCESNTKCVFRSWDLVPVCGCDTEHFFNGQLCVPRALAGDPCPYDSADVADSTLRIEFLSQCVQNAFCSSSLTCECESGFFQREGHCPPRVISGGICDPWRDDDLECETSLRCLNGVCRHT